MQELPVLQFRSLYIHKKVCAVDRLLLIEVGLLIIILIMQQQLTSVVLIHLHK